MTTLAPPEAAGWSLPDEWWTFNDAEKALLIRELEARAQQQTNQASYATPSALARALFPGYIHSPHLDLIDEAYLDADAGKADRIMICTPPQVGKSTTAAEAGPIWWLARHKRARVTVASYASKLAERRGKRVRDTIIEHGGQLGLAIQPGSNAKAEFDLLSGGGMICMGVEGGLTGFGSDLMVVDDPHKNRQEANSQTMRKAVWEWWQSTVDTRMSPGSPVILIMTRWHEDDVAARVLKNEGRIEDGGTWRVISLPAIAEGRTPKGELVIDPLGRRPGEPLSHPKLPGASREVLLDFWHTRRRRVGAREWPALFQQRPAPPEGAIFQYDWIEAGRREQAPPMVKKVVGVDPSGTATQQSDECGIVVCGKDVAGDGWVFDDRSGIMTPAEWGRKACLAYLDWECTEIVAEQNQGYEMVQDVIKNAWLKLQKEPAEAKRAAQLVAPRVVKAHSRIGKVLRAEPIAAIYEDTRIHHIGDRLDLLEEQMTGWTGEGDSPDRLDALVHAQTHLMKGPVGESRSDSVAAMSL